MAGSSTRRALSPARGSAQSFFCARSAAGKMGTFAEEVPGSDSGSATFSAGDEELAAAATVVQVVPVVTVE